MSKCKICSQKFAVSWNKLFFSGCLVCISMTRAFWFQYALENKAGILASDAWCRHTVPPVYRLPTPQGSLRKAGIPGSDVLRVNKILCHWSILVWVYKGLLAVWLISKLLINNMSCHQHRSNIFNPHDGFHSQGMQYNRWQTGRTIRNKIATKMTAIKI